MDTYKKIIAAYQALGEGRVAEIDLVAKVKEMFPGTIGVQDALMDMEACEEARLWSDGTWTIEVEPGNPVPIPTNQPDDDAKGMDQLREGLTPLD